MLESWIGPITVFTGRVVRLRACSIWALVKVQPSAPPAAAEVVSRELALATVANGVPPLIWARYCSAWAWLSVTSTLTHEVVNMDWLAL